MGPAEQMYVGSPEQLICVSSVGIGLFLLDNAFT